MSVWVGYIICQFQLVKRNTWSIHPLLSRGWRIGMNVHSFRQLGICFSSHHPASVVILVPSWQTYIVSCCDVHEHTVLCFRIEFVNFDFVCGKHSPEKMFIGRKNNIIFAKRNFVIIYYMLWRLIIISKIFVFIRESLIFSWYIIIMLTFAIQGFV